MLGSKPKLALFGHLISTHPSYRQQTADYTTADGLFSLLLYTVQLFAYTLMGLLFARHGLYLGIPVNFLLIALCIVLVLARGQKLSTIGITSKNIAKSLLTGLGFGTLFALAMNIIPSLLAGGKPIPLPAALYNLFYYFIVISLTEEIVFRGYIQTRIYGLVKRDAPAILLTALLFYTSHLPFQMLANGIRVSLVNAAIIMALHVIMNALYRKYNSLAAPLSSTAF